MQNHKKKNRVDPNYTHEPFKIIQWNNQGWSLVV